MQQYRRVAGADVSRCVIGAWSSSSTLLHSGHSVDDDADRIERSRVRCNSHVVHADELPRCRCSSATCATRAERCNELVRGAVAVARFSGPGWYSLRDTVMPQYVIERDMPGAGRMTESEIREVSLRSLEVLKKIPQIQWLYSYVTDEKIYCVYLAPDESGIREHARQMGIPASRISAVRHLIDPQKYQ